MKKTVDFFKSYCTGCGLCAGAGICDLVYTDSFFEPLLTEAEYTFCEKYCPASTDLDYKSWNWGLWGHVESAYFGYSSDEDIRYRASSGGAITSIASYLIKYNIVDGIIHSIGDTLRPWRTKTVCTTTLEELKSTCGSRYAQSSPLADIFSLMKEGQKYAFIGKPCDVLALKNYCKDHPDVGDQIYCYITFFCAGIPSERANIKLLNELGLDETTCSSLDYRGNGWPGHTKATSADGDIRIMDYNSSWGAILGRDIRKMCRFCMIGTGDYADIVCGDAWYLDENGYPDFNEHEGRNIVLCRSPIGDSIIKNAEAHGEIVLTNYLQEPKLEEMNPYQYERKATHCAKIIAMRLLLKKAPNQSIYNLSGIKNSIPFKRKWAVFKGTIGRILRGTI